MVISHRHKYLYVELPRTGSTAVAAELIENYDGESILTKHSHYSAFLRVASDEERSYRVFSGIRNPLDDAVSKFVKFQTKDYNRAKNRFQLSRWRRFQLETDKSFKIYLRLFHKTPYDVWSSVSHRRFDMLIRFEHLQEDFSKMLTMVGAEQVRPLPQKNRTREKESYVNYYTDDIIPIAVRIFGPYMRDWGYEFPEQWGVTRIPWHSSLLYELLKKPKGLYWTHIRQPRI